MKASILIVSKDRKAELRKTILILEKYISKEYHEILIFLDNPIDGSEKLQQEFTWIHWEISTETYGASKARSLLYRKAKGDILIGFDDDSHPLQHDFIERTSHLFRSRQNLGLIAYREIKGVYGKEEQIPPDPLSGREDFLTRDFLGCGFAIRKNVYNKTRGFPEWIDIYGEEVCLALEVLDVGYDLLYTYNIAVNHRVNRDLRKKSGANYLRFEKQLKNTTYFYLVYYPFPLLLKKIGRLYFVNFRKYALQDATFFKAWIKALGVNVREFKAVLRYRSPVSKRTITRFNSLRNPHY